MSVRESETRRSDLLVVGAGPGGLAAAVHAAERGVRVRVVDARQAPGGQIWRGDPGVQAKAPAASWIARADAAGVEFDFDCEVFDAPDSRSLWGRSREHLVRYDFERLVVATGARERFLPFAGWERPKIMGVGALQALCKQGYEVRGQRVVVAGTGPLLLAVAADLQARGARSVKIIEQAPRARVWKLLPRLVRHPGKLGQAARFGLKLPPGSIRYGSWVASACARPDGFELRLEGRSAGESLRCDLLACAFGLVPEIALARALGCQSRVEGTGEGHSERIVVDEDQRTSVDGVYAVGEVCGVGGVETALAEGALAGAAIGADGSPMTKLRVARDKARAFAAALGQSYALDPRLARLSGEETILCRCEGVRVSAVTGFEDARTAKLQTRCGMGPCQGRVCTPAFEFLTGSQGRSVPRPPLIPIRLSELARAWSDSTPKGSAANKMNPVDLASAQSAPSPVSNSQ